MTQQSSSKDKRDRDFIDWMQSDDDDTYPAHVKRQKTLTQGDDYDG